MKGELNSEMKLCELLVLGHCIHLQLILFACASSGQSYNVGSPVPPNFCDVIDTAMTGDPTCTVILQNFGVVLISVISVVNGFTEIKKTPK